MDGPAARSCEAIPIPAPSPIGSPSAASSIAGRWDNQLPPGNAAIENMEHHHARCDSLFLACRRNVIDFAHSFDIEPVPYLSPQILDWSDSVCVDPLNDTSHRRDGHRRTDSTEDPSNHQAVQTWLREDVTESPPMMAVMPITVTRHRRKTTIHNRELRQCRVDLQRTPR